MKPKQIETAADVAAYTRGVRTTVERIFHDRGSVRALAFIMARRDPRDRMAEALEKAELKTIEILRPGPWPAGEQREIVLDSGKLFGPSGDGQDLFALVLKYACAASDAVCIVFASEIWTALMDSEEAAATLRASDQPNRKEALTTLTEHVFDRMPNMGLAVIERGSGKATTGEWTEQGGPGASHGGRFSNFLPPDPESPEHFTDYLHSLMYTDFTPAQIAAQVAKIVIMAREQ